MVLSVRSESEKPVLLCETVRPVIFGNLLTRLVLTVAGLHRVDFGKRRSALCSVASAITRDEVTDRMAGDREGADTAASRIASEVTARIRQERSARKLGFSVTARLALVLPETDRIPWDAVASDVIAGNNIIGIDVSNGDALSATLDPQPADA